MIILVSCPPLCESSNDLLVHQVIENRESNLNQGLRGIISQKGWMPFDIRYTDSFCRNARETSAFGRRPFLKVAETINPRHFSKPQSSTIICSNLINAMTVVRQCELASSGEKFLYFISNLALESHAQTIYLADICLRVWLLQSLP